MIKDQLELINWRKKKNKKVTSKKILSHNLSGEQIYYLFLFFVGWTLNNFLRAGFEPEAVYLWITWKSGLNRAKFAAKYFYEVRSWWFKTTSSKVINLKLIDNWFGTDFWLTVISHSPEDKEALALAGVQAEIFNSLKLYPEKLDVLESAIGAIACLADVGKLQCLIIIIIWGG